MSTYRETDITEHCSFAQLYTVHIKYNVWLKKALPRAYEHNVDT